MIKRVICKWKSKKLYRIFVFFAKLHWALFVKLFSQKSNILTNSQLKGYRTQSQKGSIKPFLWSSLIDILCCPNDLWCKIQLILPKHWKVNSSWWHLRAVLTTGYATKNGHALLSFVKKIKNDSIMIMIMIRNECLNRECRS